MSKLAKFLNSLEFYNLAQAYRHMPHVMQAVTIEAFEALKRGILEAAQPELTAEELKAVQAALEDTQGGIQRMPGFRSAYLKLSKVDCEQR
jgi:hypothetical protein